MFNTHSILKQPDTICISIDNNDLHNQSKNSSNDNIPVSQDDDIVKAPIDNDIQDKNKIISDTQDQDVHDICVELTDFLESKGYFK